MENTPEQQIFVHEQQRVEHENLVHTVTVTCKAHRCYATIDGVQLKVYRTGNQEEPWTTNLSRYIKY